jgi:hypothetical protein
MNDLANAHVGINLIPECLVGATWAPIQSLSAFVAAPQASSS